MAKNILDRRTVLKGVLATGATVSIPLPLLEIMLNENGTAYAQSATPVPPIFVLWFFGNGSLPGIWKPAKTGTGSNVLTANITGKVSAGLFKGRPVTSQIKIKPTKGNCAPTPVTEISFTNSKPFLIK